MNEQPSDRFMYFLTGVAAVGVLSVVGAVIAFLFDRKQLFAALLALSAGASVFGKLTCDRILRRRP